MGLLTRRAIGLLPVGADLIVVEATARGSRAQWRVETIANFFDADAPPVLPEWAVPGAHVPCALLWPTDAVLRREIDIAGQSVDDFRAAVGDNLGSFFPAASAESMLWDVAPITGAAGSPGAWIGAIPRERIEPALARLAAAGAAPTRIAPSAIALPLLLRSLNEADRPSSVLEISPSGWALHQVDGLRWNGCRAGAGEPSAAVFAEATRRSATTLRWAERAPAPESGPSPESLALCGAMLGAWPRLGTEAGRAPAFNFLGRRERRRLFESAPVRWIGAAAAVLIATMILADSVAARSRAEQIAVLARAEVLGPEAERVDAARAVNASLIAAHDRLWRLESNYRPRWQILAWLSGALPAPAWVERLEVSDDTILADILAPAAAPVLEALEAWPTLEQVKQIGPATTLESGESRLRIEARLVPPEAPPAEGATP